MSDPIQPGDAEATPLPSAPPTAPPTPPPSAPPTPQWSAPTTPYVAPAPYGYAGYGYAPATRRTSGEAIAALVLALTAWAVCPVILAIIALVLASRADREIKASAGWVDGAGMVTAARVISWINIAVGIAFAVFFIALFAFAAVAPDNGFGTSI